MPHEESLMYPFMHSAAYILAGPHNVPLQYISMYPTVHIDRIHTYEIPSLYPTY